MRRALLIAVFTRKHHAYAAEDEARLLAVAAPKCAWEREGRFGH